MIITEYKNSLLLIFYNELGWTGGPRHLHEYFNMTPEIHFELRDLYARGN